MRNVIIAGLVLVGFAGLAGLTLNSCGGSEVDSGTVTEEVAPVVADTDTDIGESVDEPTGLTIDVVAPATAPVVAPEVAPAAPVAPATSAQ